MTQANHDKTKTTFSATLLNHKDLHNDIAQIIHNKLKLGIGSSRKEWQDFLCSPLCEYSQFSGIAVDQSARLIEVVTLDVITSYINDINKGRLKYTPAFLPQQSDASLIPVLGKDSCDGLMFEMNDKNPNPIFIEQKSSMRNPGDSGIGDINDYFEDWINNLLKDAKGDRLFWVFNIMPYSDEQPESRNPFDLDKAISLVHAKKQNILAGAVCFYTHPDNSSLEIICAPIREAAKSNHSNTDEVKKMRFTI